MSKIQWTDRTWNPVRGCSRVSEGCRNCYAEREAGRFAGEGQYMHGFVRRIDMRGAVDEHKARAGWTGRVELVPAKLDEPLRWRKPARVFVNSMSDLFHESLSDESIAAVFGVMAACPSQTFQVLTKRAKRMREWFGWAGDKASSRAGATWPQERISDAAHRVMGGRSPGQAHMLDPRWPLPNVWLGVSVEDQSTADARIPVLLRTPAALRFVSYEPALGPVDFGNIRVSEDCHEDVLGDGYWNGVEDCPPGVDWVIVGGESGPGARPCNVDWIKSVVDQCKAARAPVFVKQLGAHPIGSERVRWEMVGSPEEWQPSDALVRWNLRDRKGGDPGEWPEKLCVREFPEVRHG